MLRENGPDPSIGGLAAALATIEWQDNPPTIDLEEFVVAGGAELPILTLGGSCDKLTPFGEAFSDILPPDAPRLTIEALKGTHAGWNELWALSCRAILEYIPGILVGPDRWHMPCDVGPPDGMPEDTIGGVVVSTDPGFLSFERQSEVAKCFVAALFLHLFGLRQNLGPILRGSSLPSPLLGPLITRFNSDGF